MILDDLNFDDIDLDVLFGRDYDGKEFDMTEYVGVWNGYDVYLGYADGEDHVLLVKGKRAWYPNSMDLDEIKYIFDLWDWLIDCHKTGEVGRVFPRTGFAIFPTAILKSLALSPPKHQACFYESFNSPA